MAQNYVTPQILMEAIAHWLRTRPWSYLGRRYGFDGASYAMRPLSADFGADLERDMRRDIAWLGSLPAGAVAISGETVYPDQKRLEIAVGSAAVQLWISSGGVARVSAV